VPLISDTRRPFVLALASRIVPESAAVGCDEHDRMLALVEFAMADRPAAMRRQFVLFLSVLRWAPALRYGRRFDRLDAARQDAVLRAYQHAPLQLLRSGFWGVRTIIMMAFYARPGVGASIGYRPGPDGNAVLHARTQR
jgi:hypothetical protein